MSFVGRIIGTVTFNRKQVKNVAEKGDATAQAVLILLIGTIISAGIAYLTFQQTHNFNDLGSYAFIYDLVFANQTPTAISVFIVAFLISLLPVLFIAFCLAFIGRVFGGKFSTMECFRILAFASVLTILSAIVVYFATTSNQPSLLYVDSIIAIWQFCVVIYAYSVGGDIGIIRSLIAYIVAFIFAFVLLVVILLSIIVILINI